MKILVFGSCNLDYVYNLDHIVSAGETESTNSFDVFPGGKGLNQAIAVAKAGVPVYFAGCVGSDGEILTDILVENNVDISFLKRLKAKNGHAIIQVGAIGENAIFLYPGSNELITKEYIDFVLGHFSEDDIILLQNEISNVDYIVDQAYRKKMRIVFNPSPFNEKIKQIDFNKVTHTILNEVEICALSNRETPEECLNDVVKNFPNLQVVLTLGKDGSIYRDHSNEIYQPSFKVNAIDTTAAGDTFTGYFIAELSKGTSYTEILKTASVAAAIAVSREGAAPSIPSINEVMNELDVLLPNNDRRHLDLTKKRIEIYIEENIRTANLAQLSMLLGYSTVYTGKLVKQLLGISFSKFVQAKRCDMAARKLIQTDLSIEAIIKEIGYENESFFRKIFKEKYGINPLEFRKRG